MTGKPYKSQTCRRTEADNKFPTAICVKNELVSGLTLEQNKVNKVKIRCCFPIFWSENHNDPLVILTGINYLGIPL